MMHAEFLPLDPSGIPNDSVFGVRDWHEDLEAPFVVQELFRQMDGAANLHRHLEGILTVDDIVDIAHTLGIDLQDIDEMRRQRAGNLEPSLTNFFLKLTTPDIKRLIKQGALQGEESFVSPEVVVRLVIEKALDRAYNEGIRVLDLLASPFALTFDGDLRQEITIETPKTQEQQVTNAWTKALQDGSISDEVTSLTTEKYFEMLRDVVSQHSDKYAWGGQEDHEGQSDRMVIGVRACLRREKPAEKMLMNDENGQMTKEGLEYANRLVRLFQKGLIHGVDMAGDESDARYKLSNFSGFLEYMNARVFLTVHAGEIVHKPLSACRYDEWQKEIKRRDLAYENLSYAIDVLKVRRIGHAIALFTDQSERMISLRKRARKRRTYIEANIISNRWTGVACNPLRHPVMLAAMNGEYDKKLIVINDDDPVVTGSRTPLADEYVLGAAGTDNFGFDTPYEAIKYFIDNAKRAPSWLLRKKRYHRTLVNLL